MAEPQPPNVHEGADPPDVLPANAEDRKAAAAMSSLDGRADDATSRKEVDLRALNEAMKNLGAGDDKAKKQQPAAPAGKKDDVVPKKPLVKVDPVDVALLVDQLDINKIKATELLRAYDADVKKALTAWVTAAV